MLNTLDLTQATIPSPPALSQHRLSRWRHAAAPHRRRLSPHERKLPPELKAELDANEVEGKALAERKERPTPEQLAKWEATNKKIRECPPDGNIWEVTAKHGWRARNWLDQSLSGHRSRCSIAQRWCGFGCTLLNAEALAQRIFPDTGKAPRISSCAGIGGTSRPAHQRHHPLPMRPCHLGEKERRRFRQIHPSLCLSRADRRNRRTPPAPGSLSGGNSSDCTTTSPVWGHQQDRSDRLPTGALHRTSFPQSLRSVFAPL